jgi:asparagine synthase (glutamine-hydrolysing)
MSVQAGMWNYDGCPADQSFLDKISHDLAEFGPDGEEKYSDGSVGMLYRAFHSTPESCVETQPYIAANGMAITWDGRLDNRDELLPQLRGHLQSDLTDVALVAAALERWGTDCFGKLIGDWAIAVWSREKRELILARDYVGVRHLFYFHDARRIAWCSHLSSLAQSGKRFTVCDEYIAGYLVHHPDAGLTPYQEIRSVPPGKFVKVHDGKITIHTYWNFDFQSRVSCKTDAEYEEQFRHLFRQAVRRRLRTDPPVLSELSGGLDSSSIVCMADDIFAREGVSAQRLDTFSYYDSNEPSEDDFVHLTKIVEKRGGRAFRVDLKGEGDSLPLSYSKFVAIPGFGHRAELTSAFSKILELRKYRVMLSGLGGDEMNGQPLNPRLLMANLLADFQLKELSRQLIAWSLLTRKPAIHLFAGMLAQFMPAVVRARFSKEGKREKWITQSFARKYKLEVRQVGMLEGPGYFRPGSRESAEAVIALGRQMTQMGPSLIERRYPYLDQNLVEFLSIIPLTQLLQPGERRFLMRRALKDIVPAMILARKTKASAARCYAATLEKHWPQVEKLFAAAFSSRLGYVDQNQLLATLLSMKHGHSPRHFLRQLKALSLELWLRDAETRGVISIPLSDSSMTAGNLIQSNV